MPCCDIRVCGKDKVLKGLALDVCDVLSRLDGVDYISLGRPRGYKGARKVKIPERWPPFCLPIIVCDTEFGERAMEVRASKRPAIARILRRRLSELRITCE